MMQRSLHIKHYIIRNLFKYTYYLVLYIQSVLIIECFISKVSLLSSSLYATCANCLGCAVRGLLKGATLGPTLLLPGVASTSSFACHRTRFSQQRS